MKRTLHRGATVGVGIDRGILVVVHGRAAPNKEDWAVVCQTVLAHYATARGQVVLSLGGMPNAAQRKQAIDQLPRGFIAPPVAVLSNDLLLRGAITAMNWFLNDSHRAFKPDDIAGVAAHLRVTDDVARELVDFAHEFAPK